MIPLKSRLTWALAFLAGALLTSERSLAGVADDAWFDFESARAEHAARDADFARFEAENRAADAEAARDAAARARLLRPRYSGGTYEHYEYSPSGGAYVEHYESW